MSASAAESYTLDEFLDVYELPKDVLVTEGFAFAGQSDDTDIGTATGEKLRLLRARSVCYLSGQTLQGKHNVSIPTDCQQKIEIPSTLFSSHGPVETVRNLVERFRQHVKYVRVLRSESLPNGEVIKAGEILELLFMDNADATLVAVDRQECEVRLPLTCSAGFSLLNYGKDYLLSELLSEGLLPMSVRFVDSVPAKVRETFIERDHNHCLGMIFLEKGTFKRRGVDVIFHGRNELSSWFPMVDIDISVSLLENTPTGRNTEGNQPSRSSEHQRDGGNQSDDEHETGKSKFSLRGNVLSMYDSMRRFRTLRRPKSRISEMFSEDRSTAAEDSAMPKKATHVPSPSPAHASKESAAAECAEPLQSSPYYESPYYESPYYESPYYESPVSQTYSTYNGPALVRSPHFSPKQPLSPHIPSAPPPSPSYTSEESEAYFINKPLPSTPSSKEGGSAVWDTCERVYEQPFEAQKPGVPISGSPKRFFPPHSEVSINLQSKDVYDDVQPRQPGERKFLLPQAASIHTSTKLDYPNKSPPSVYPFKPPPRPQSLKGTHSDVYPINLQSEDVYDDVQPRQPGERKFLLPQAASTNTSTQLDYPNKSPPSVYPIKPPPRPPSLKGTHAPACSKTSECRNVYVGVGGSKRVPRLYRADLPKRDTFCDIPLDVSGLSGRDVLSLLERMNLEQYTERFLAAKVNGSFLMDLNVDILVDNFGLTAYHAKKLSEFVKGWRPQFSSNSNYSKRPSQSFQGIS